MTEHRLRFWVSIRSLLSGRRLRWRCSCGERGAAAELSFTLQETSPEVCPMWAFTLSERESD